MLGGAVSAADAPPGYAPVAELLAAVRGDFESEVRLPAGAGQPRRRRHGMRMAVLLAAAALVFAAGASYADVLPSRQRASGKR